MTPDQISRAQELLEQRLTQRLSLTTLKAISLQDDELFVNFSINNWPDHIDYTDTRYLPLRIIYEDLVKGLENHIAQIETELNKLGVDTSNLES